MLKYRDVFPSRAVARAGASQNHGMSLEDASSLAIMVTDPDGQCLYSNIAYQKLCGWSGDELIGSHWSAVIEPQDHQEAIQHWNRAVLGQESFMSEARLRRSDGGVIWVRRNAALLTDNLPNLGYVHTIEDISSHKDRDPDRKEMVTEHPTQHDALTGLHNRSAFYERFDQSRAVAVRYKHQMGLLFIDLDNFRSIHEHRGHDVGDRILVELARRLTKLVRATDTVCRYGVDEFVLLLGEISHRDHASAVADKIRETVSAPIAVGGHIVALQLSIGVSIYPDNGMIADDLFKKAKTVL